MKHTPFQPYEQGIWSGTPWSGAIQNSGLFWMGMRSAIQPIRSGIQNSGLFWIGVCTALKKFLSAKCPAYELHRNPVLRIVFVRRSSGGKQIFYKLSRCVSIATYPQGEQVNRGANVNPASTLESFVDLIIGYVIIAPTYQIFYLYCIYDLEEALVVHRLGPGHLGEVQLPHHWLSLGQ